MCIFKSYILRQKMYGPNVNSGRDLSSASIDRLSGFLQYLRALINPFPNTLYICLYRFDIHMYIYIYV